MSEHRIALLSSPSAFTRYLASKLAEEVNLCAIVWEQRRLSDQFLMYRRRARKIGLLRVLDQAALKAYSSLFHRGRISCAVKELFGEPIVPKVPTLHVENINTGRVLYFLKQFIITACVVSGTGLIKEPLLGAYAGKLVNIHTGWTPEYRGAHGGFWALYLDDPDHCGVTIHIIDRGVDTGGALWQKRVPLSQSDPPIVMARKQQRAAADSVGDVVKRYLDGQILPQRPEQNGKLYYAPGLSDYFRFRWKYRKQKNAD